MTLSENTICFLGFLAALVITSSPKPHQVLAQLVALPNAGKKRATRPKKLGRGRSTTTACIFKVRTGSDLR